MITLSDLKAHLNLTSANDDDLLTAKIAAEEDWVELFIGCDLADLKRRQPSHVTAC